MAYGLLPAGTAAYQADANARDVAALTDRSKLPADRNRLTTVASAADDRRHVASHAAEQCLYGADASPILPLAGVMLLRLPARGRLLVATDMQGHRADFAALRDHFLVALDEEPDTTLLLAGDMVHGPQLEPDDWGDWLGEFYRDDSVGLFADLVALQAAYPGRVIALLGNHEHAHIGGVRTAKFFDDEAAELEAQMSAETVKAFRSFCRALPLVVACPAGIVVTHGAPAIELNEPGEIERLSHDPKGLDPEARALLTTLLWARACTRAQARGVLSQLVGRPEGVCIYGHDVVAGGFQRDGETICVSTSFGLFDSHKVYLDLDLSRRYRNALDLREGIEIRRLYPKAQARSPFPAP